MGDWVIIGVPSSAGAHHAGQERAPDALRAAGLVIQVGGPLRHLPVYLIAPEHVPDEGDHRHRSAANDT
jgi:arginase family enzyme